MKYILISFVIGITLGIGGSVLASSDVFTHYPLPEHLIINLSYNSPNAKCKTGTNWIEATSPQLDRSAGICFPRTIKNYEAVEKTAKLLEAFLGQEINFTYRSL